jgi:hypothetical protein
MRTRLLHPEFFRHEGLAELPRDARLLFAGLWTISDRQGRIEDRPRRIQADLFPYDEGLSVDALLDQLAGPASSSDMQWKTSGLSKSPPSRDGRSLTPERGRAHYQGQPKANLGSPKARQGGRFLIRFLIQFQFLIRFPVMPLSRRPTRFAPPGRSHWPNGRLRASACRSLPPRP